MLTLSRKLGETITIGGIVEVSIVKVQGQKVQVGISAPRSIKVRRGPKLTRPSTGTDTTERK